MTLCVWQILLFAECIVKKYDFFLFIFKQKKILGTNIVVLLLIDPFHFIPFIRGLWRHSPGNNNGSLWITFWNFSKKKMIFFHHYYLYMVWCVAWWLMMMMMITVDYGLRNRFIHSILVKKNCIKIHILSLCVCVYVRMVNDKKRCGTDCLIRIVFCV